MDYNLANDVKGDQVEKRLLAHSELGTYASQIPIYFHSGNPRSENAHIQEERYLAKGDIEAMKAKLTTFCEKAIKSASKRMAEKPSSPASPKTPPTTLSDTIPSPPKLR